MTTDQPKRKFRTHEVDLTAEDILRYTKRTTILRREISSKETQLRRNKDALSTELGELKDKLEALYTRIDTGKETREIEVIERINWDRKVVEIVWAEHDLVIDERPITEADQQGHLGFNDLDGTVKEEVDPYADLPLSELRKLCTERGIKCSARTPREEVLRRLRAAKEEANGEAEGDEAQTAESAGEQHLHA